MTYWQVPPVRAVSDSIPGFVELQYVRLSKIEDFPEETSNSNFSLPHNEQFQVLREIGNTKRQIQYSGDTQPRNPASDQMQNFQQVIGIRVKEPIKTAQ